MKKFDACKAECPSHKLLNIIGNKWIILILHKLSQKTYRFGELNREVEGISKKVLMSSLRKLEKNRLVQRQAYSTLQLKVEYSLTSLGQSLSIVCNSMTKWAEENISKIENEQIDST